MRARREISARSRQNYSALASFLVFAYLETCDGFRLVVCVDVCWMDCDMCCCRGGCWAVIMVLRRATKQDTDLQCWLALWVGVVMGGVLMLPGGVMLWLWFALWCGFVWRGVSVA